MSEITIEITREPVEISRIFKSDFQKPKTRTLELKQKVVIKKGYPKEKLTKDFQSEFISYEEYNLERKYFESTETRVDWVNVPKSYSLKDVKDKLLSFKECCIYKILSNYPIIGNSKEYAIKEGLTTKEDIAEKQIVRYPEGHEKSGEIILDKLGRPIYRLNCFYKEYHKDVDYRDDNPKSFYLSTNSSYELEVVESPNESEVVSPPIQDIF